ncbi:MAG TPA: toprim domain-containing protein [Pseudoneobacillus sp.]|nr:toprim domain-containing protein [Pseudoneobacillus sp.]
MSEKRDQIRELSTREQCRDKLPIFFGSRENYLHGFREVIGNAIDEVNNNYSKGVINVTLYEDLQTISVADTGRGIPIDGETNGKPNYVLLFETLFAGTNYDNNANGKIAVGTNGVGTCVLNHTSSLFKVTSVRDGKKHIITYKDGGILDGGLVSEDNPSATAHGSIFTFRLDPEVYTNVKYNPDEIKAIIKRLAATANQITFKFTHKGESTSYHYDGLSEYFDEIATNLTSSPVSGPLADFNQENEVNKITILFATASEPIQESYLNINWLPDQGTIHDGIIAGIRNYLNRHCKDTKQLDAKTNLGTGDIEDSVTYVCSVLSTNVEYANQTKLSTNKKLYRSIAMEYVQSLLEALKAEQPKEFEKFVNHILQVHKFNNRNTAAKQALKKKLNEKVEGIGNKVEKLKGCKTYGPSAELFIAEGESALGSIVLARDGNYQAAYPLRGKILNCLKADYATIFKNQVILDLVKVLGCGIQADKKNKDLESFNIKNLRFGKIVIATDADADGQQIACLIITMFYRLMPSLVEGGYLYIAKTPLYEVKLDNDDMIYFFSEKEKDEKLPLMKGKYTISRCKGLGELEAETMAYTAMDEKTRNLDRVTVDDAKKMVEMVEMFMGTDITDRKAYIEENLHKYIDNAIAD